MMMITKPQLKTMTTNTKPKGRYKWTKERVDTLIKLYKENHAIKVIAEKMGTTTNSASGKIKRLRQIGEL